MGNNSNNKNTGLKVALVLVSIFLIISLIAVYYVYMNPPDTQDQISNLQNQKASLESQVSDLQTQISELGNQIATLESQQTENGGTDLQSQIDDLQSQLNSLTTTYNDYVATHSHSNSEYDALVNEIDNLKASNLIARLSISDQRPFLQTPYLHVSGEVWNVGTNTATNCKLHVILYQGSVVAEDTYINLGTISGEYFKDVDERIYYQGESLTNWSVSPEWD